MRWLYADELLENMLLKYPLTALARAPLTDLYECSEHYYARRCKTQPGMALELNFEFMARRSDAVESGRTKLRGCVLISEVAATIKQTVKKQEQEAAAPVAAMEGGEVTAPPAKVASVDLLIRPPGRPPMMTAMP